MTVPMRGRLDRVDRHPVSGVVRVIDYKYRANSRVEAKDRNLLQAAIRAHRLQPALYALMTPCRASRWCKARPSPEQVEFVYLLPQGEPAVDRASLTRLLGRAIRAVAESGGADVTERHPGGPAFYCAG